MNVQERCGRHRVTFIQVVRLAERYNRDLLDLSLSIPSIFTLDLGWIMPNDLVHRREPPRKVLGELEQELPR